MSIKAEGRDVEIKNTKGGLHLSPSEILPVIKKVVNVWMCTEQNSQWGLLIKWAKVLRYYQSFYFYLEGTTLSLFVCKELLLMYIHCTTTLVVTDLPSIRHNQTRRTTDTPGFKPYCSAVGLCHFYFRHRYY